MMDVWVLKVTSRRFRGVNSLEGVAQSLPLLVNESTSVSSTSAGVPA